MMSETELSTGKHVYSQIYLEGKSIKENDRRGKKPMRGEKEKPKGEGGGGRMEPVGSGEEKNGANGSPMEN